MNDSNAIALNEFDYLQKIKSSNDIETILKILRSLDAVQKALEAADTFRKQSVLFAKFEAEALIKLAQLGGLNSLNKKRRGAAEWLFKLSKKECDEWILKCEEGKTIDNVWWDEFGRSEKNDNDLREIKSKENKILSDVKIFPVSLENFNCYVKNKFGREVANDLTDGLRNRLRNVGAVGIGDSKGTYFMPSSDNAYYCYEALSVRVNSIKNDLEAIRNVVYPILEVVEPIDYCSYEALSKSDPLILGMALAYIKLNKDQVEEFLGDKPTYLDEVNSKKYGVDEKVLPLSPAFIRKVKEAYRGTVQTIKTAVYHQ